MNKTGTYIWNKELGKLMKISDRAASCGGAFSTICEKVEAPYWDEHIADKPTYVRSRAHKAALLKKEGLVQRRFRGGRDLF